MSVARRGPDGQIIPGEWIIPGVGPSRFKTRAAAERQADALRGYGEHCWGVKIEEEPSQSDPTRTVFQIYIRSLGGIEGLIR